MILDAEQTAVVVVDMQNDFCHPDGSLYADNSEKAIKPCQKLIQLARDSGARVIFTRDVHSKEQFDDVYYYDEFSRWGEHVLEDSWGAELVEELSPKQDELVVTKHTYDAFYQTNLEEWLATKGINDLIFCGTLANVCVLHTAGSAGLRDYRPILIKDAIGCIKPEHKKYALEHADWLFGEVVELGEVEFK